MKTALDTGCGVWADLIGQDRLVAQLRRAAAGEDHAMTHAWLFVGPPGSGRSNAALAFAAALQCRDQGCGSCSSCIGIRNNSHPDVKLVRTEKLSIGVDEVRDLVRQSALTPALGRYQILIIEDADRVTERGADALLKSLEEPTPRTLWMLCAPTPDDVVPTIRSRCRKATLVTPHPAAISQLLQIRDGIDPATADFAARVAQGHIGRAKSLASDPQAQQRRLAILAIPSKLKTLNACLEAAQELIDTANAEAAAITSKIDAEEMKHLTDTLGVTAGKTRPRHVSALFTDMEEQQKKRSTRVQRDCLDRVLTEFTSFYRDVLILQTEGQIRLINQEFADSMDTLAKATNPQDTIGKLDSILTCRKELMSNVSPQLALESLLITLAGLSS
ncbi:MAG: DNA polymerase III subunit delta' [Propionibacteriaceae bacterium]|nr:DNA polymerase III subunit delta' [Propionibacteriaceae bacterium]